MLLSSNLQMFAEDDDNLDLDSMLEEFESEWEDSNDESETETETDYEATESEEDTTPDEDGEEAETDDQEQETEPNPHDENEHKRNQAFAKLREEAEANRKYAAFIQKLAEEGGVTPDDLLARYEDKRIQEQAEEQGVPVELLKRQTSTEQELAQLKEQMFAERLQAQVDSVMSKYGNDENLVRSTFEYMAQAGIDPRVQQVDFEKLYRAANLDTIIQKEVANARQADLANKKKRQDGASIANGSSVSPPSGDLSDEEVDSILAKFDIRI
jgi:hypothetical protein